ncbi:MAG: DUF1311 domain-containing protein [Lachnospiraceae bacterium]|nr:DUF1311 domain-containing protein [Lachnospiraceae bacterium]
MKLKLVLMGLVLSFCLCSCGDSGQLEKEATDNNSIEVQSDEKEESAEITDENADSGKAENSFEKTIQEELADIEIKSAEITDRDSTNMTQTDMNLWAMESYDFWDKELNSLWSRLSDEINPSDKTKLVEEQRAWINQKEANSKVPGIVSNGGSIVPCLEYSTKEWMTRDRVYKLAALLAEIRGEEFTIPDDVAKDLEENTSDLYEIFEDLEGQWIFDIERGAAVGVETVEECEYLVDDPNCKWVVWETGGGTYTDLDVYGYDGRTIVFYRNNGDFESYYMISRYDNQLETKYGNSIEELTAAEPTICE